MFTTIRYILTAVYNGTSKVAEYAYDAYGNCRVITGSNIGTLNPFRYRGYYFDEDMKLYYLQSRYYDPETGRFINADDVSYLDPETIHGLNLYAYCLNNPVMDVDPTGCFPWGILALIGVVVVLGILVPEIGTAVNSQKSESVIYYDSPDQLAQAWAQAYYNTSFERCSIIMTTVIDGKTKYYFERVYDGSLNSVAFQFYCGYVHQQMKSLFANENVYGFIHSHPSGKTYPSDADEFLKLMPNIDVSYIASSSVHTQQYQTTKTFWQALWDMIKKIPLYF